MVVKQAHCTNFYSDIQALVDANPHKVGIAILCVSGNFVPICTALERMDDCLGMKLGYLPISVGTNMTTSQLDLLISQLTTLKLPESYNRIIAYFFGHGNDDSLQFADEFVERQYIISKFQLISPTNENLYKIFIFDSCRMANATTCDAIKESSDYKALAGEPWKSKGQYPESVDTLVINATTYNSKAYYRESDGCGLLTKFFTELAPTRNESLRDLLAVIRQKIAHETQLETSKTTQILVYEDKVMGIINLLAESQGTGIYSYSNYHRFHYYSLYGVFYCFQLELFPHMCLPAHLFSAPMSTGGLMTKFRLESSSSLWKSHQSCIQSSQGIEWPPSLV